MQRMPYRHNSLPGHRVFPRCLRESLIVLEGRCSCTFAQDCRVRLPTPTPRATDPAPHPLRALRYELPPRTWTSTSAGNWTVAWSCSTGATTVSQPRVLGSQLWSPPRVRSWRGIRPEGWKGKRRSTSCSMSRLESPPSKWPCRSWYRSGPVNSGVCPDPSALMA